jgi:hypothetical protein
LNTARYRNVHFKGVDGNRFVLSSFIFKDESKQMVSPDINQRRGVSDEDVRLYQSEVRCFGRGQSLERQAVSGVSWTGRCRLREQRRRLTGENCTEMLWIASLSAIFASLERIVFMPKRHVNTQAHTSQIRSRSRNAEPVTHLQMNGLQNIMFTRSTSALTNFSLTFEPKGSMVQ